MSRMKRSRNLQERSATRRLCSRLTVKNWMRSRRREKRRPLHSLARLGSRTEEFWRRDPNICFVERGGLGRMTEDRNFNILFFCYSLGFPGGQFPKNLNSKIFKKKK